MICEKLVISGHGFQKMFERFISVENVESVIKEGEIIKEYFDDKPYPTFLLLGFINKKALHIVIAKNEKEKNCILVTAYFPDASMWDATFKNKLV